jgi:hypothetical protein
MCLASSPGEGAAYKMTYLCSLCGVEYTPTTKRNNVEQHIWTNHGDVHGGNAKIFKYRASQHKQLVTQYVSTAAASRHASAVPVDPPVPNGQSSDSEFPTAGQPLTARRLSKVTTGKHLSVVGNAPSTYRSTHSTHDLSSASILQRNVALDALNLLSRHQLSRLSGPDSSASRYHSMDVDSACDTHFERSRIMHQLKRARQTSSNPYYVNHHPPSRVDTPNPVQPVGTCDKIDQKRAYVDNSNLSLWRPYCFP